jgi:hypothetical protein
MNNTKNKMNKQTGNHYAIVSFFPGRMTDKHYFFSGKGDIGRMRIRLSALNAF